MFDKQELMKLAISDTECNCLTCRTARLEKVAAELITENVSGFETPRKADINSEHFRLINSAFTARDWFDNLAHAINVIQLASNSKKTKTKTERCSDCGLYHSPLKLTDLYVPGMVLIRVCKTCLKNYYWCTRCHLATYASDPDLRIMRSPIGSLCEDCFYSTYNECDCCGKTYEKEKIKDLNQIEGFQQHDLRRQGRFRICEECLKTQVSTCHICHEKILSRHGNKWATNNQVVLLCSDCYSLMNRDIQQFDFKPRKFPKLLSDNERRVRPDTLMFGVELEIEPINDKARYDGQRNDVARKMLSYLGRDKALVKHDGTVRDGVEVVTFPFTWSWLKYNKSLWTGFFDLMKELKHTATNGITGNAGFHVHMTKSAFNTLHLYKYIGFLYDENHRELVKLVAQRTKGWEQYASFRVEDCGKHVKQLAKQKINNRPNVKTGDSRQHMRHSAISLMYPPTVELRIFGGTDTYEGFMKNLEFCMSVYEFTKQASIKQLVLEEYFKFLCERNNKHRFKNLYNFLANSRPMKKYHKMVALTCAKTLKALNQAKKETN